MCSPLDGPAWPQYAEQDPMCTCNWMTRHECPAAWLVVVMLLCTPASADAERADAVLYRIFLADGSTLVSYGEHSRVGDQVIFSLPVSADLIDPRLHLVSIPMARIDWTQTERYAESARYAHYAATRGESDFVVMSADVARALNDIALTADPVVQLNIAERARATLMAWPREHYGYRANDVLQIVALLDEAISEIRVAAGEQRFNLSFVAMAEPPPSMPLMPEPTLQETIAQVLGASRLTEVPAEQLSLLRSVVGLLQEGAALLPKAWAASIRALAASEIATEMEPERAYASLSGTLLERATARAAHADVRGVEQTLHDIQRQDHTLGRKRPQQISALVAAVAAKLRATRQLRLERDRWALRIRSYRDYQRALSEPFATFTRLRPMLDDVRALAGPTVTTLDRLEGSLAEAEQALGVTTPPVDLQLVHDLLVRAFQFARLAVSTRRQAVTSGELRTAWDASSAASGSLMLFAQVEADLARHLKVPELR